MQTLRDKLAEVVYYAEPAVYVHSVRVIPWEDADNMFKAFAYSIVDSLLGDSTFTIMETTTYNSIINSITEGD